MGNPRKLVLFDNDEETSVITQMDSVAADENIKNIFGIDLGTTNSVISIVKKGAPEVIRLVDGRLTFPSCVMWKNNEFIVGAEAYKNKGLPNVQYSVKRLMEDADAKVTFKDGDNELTMTPTEVSAEILKGIVKAAGDMYGTVHDVVVTVPAYFNDIGKRNTMKACELAGLNLIALENEPSAAILEYDLPDGVSSEDVIVYDLGGGTFDVTLARIMKVESSAFDAYGFGNATLGSTSKIVKPIALGGDGKLGGDDIDNELFKIIMKKMEIDPSDVGEFDTKRFTASLERMKKTGIDQTYETEFEADLLTGEHVCKKVSVQPEDFAASVLPVFEKTRKELNRVLAERPNTASKILLVGGSTKNPIIRQMLEETYRTFEISSALNPDLVVSTGAAVKGRILKYGDSSISSFDILPMTIGILEGSSTILPVIEKNEELPISHSSYFTTKTDNQTEMRVAIYQGNSSHKSDCVYLGDLIIDDIPKAKAGTPKLTVTLTITANNVLKCEASINGQVKSIELSLNNSEVSATSLSREEKKLIRWREFAESIKNKKNRDHLNKLLDGYPGDTSEEQIKEFIRSIRGKK